MITEVFPKIGYPWIITVAVHRLSHEVLSVVSDLVFDVPALRVEFIFFSLIRSIQVFILCHPIDNEDCLPVIIHVSATFPTFLVSRFQVRSLPTNPMTVCFI